MKRSLCNLHAAYVLLCTSAAIYLSACTTDAGKSTNTAETFQVIHPETIDTVYTKDYVAEIQSVQNVEIRARVKGFIEKIYVDEGKPVREGQVLFTLSNKEFKEELLKATAELKSAEADLKAADVDMKNTKLLVDKKIVSNSELEMADAKKEAIQARIDEAESSIAVAKLNLSFTEVRAPFSGVINRIPNKTGSLVDEGTLLTTLSDNKEMFAYFNVSEKEYLDFVKQKELGKPQQVSLLMADGNLFPYKGTVETIENEIDKSTGNLAFRARFVNPDQILKHGATAKVLMNTELKNAMLIPQKSTFEIQENVYVYVVDNNNTVQMRKIIPSLRLPNLYVVSSGLSLNDNIIYEGIQRVKEGDKIIPEKALLTQTNNL